MSELSLHESDAAALYHIPKRKTPDPNTGLDVTLYTWGRTEVIKAVQEEGVALHISRGAGAYDMPGVVDVLSPILRDGSYTTARPLGIRALDAYGAIRSISGSLAHVTDVSVLTDTRVRSIASDKLATANMLSTLDLHEGAQSVRSEAELVEALTRTYGNNIVLKPRYGSRSEGVIVTNKKNAPDQFRTREKQDAEYVLEEKLDFTTPFPVSLRGIDEANQRRLERANQEGANKELRAVYFGDNQFAYIARAAKEGEVDFRADDWVYIDSDTIPDAILATNERILREVEARSGIREFHIAIDYTFATTDTDKEPKWRVMEINAGEPQLVREDQNRDVAREQAGLLARQIARVARKRTLQ
ncbi:MAG TPA: hypothetical protein PKD68_03825 [Candidatus Saccharibacteria bacterium]|nr:hypothetical protein [Candidatus Saccharibacteria bacterium]